MKTKPIPESWQYFHELVLAHETGSDYTLSNLYRHAHCASDLPQIYKKLGWVVIGETPHFYRYLGPKTEKLTHQMADQIRANWGKTKRNLKKISKVSQKSQMPTTEETKEKIMETRAEELKKFWDADLVTELRRRGYEVTAKKTVEL